MYKHLKHEIKESPAMEIREHAHLKNEASLHDVRKIEHHERKELHEVHKECKY